MILEKINMLVDLQLQYDSIKNAAEKNGVNEDIVNEIMPYFHCQGNRYIAKEAFWKPSGIVLGYPLNAELTKKIISIRNNIIQDLNLINCWEADSKYFHITIVSYSHFKEIGLNATKKIFPKKEIKKAAKIIGEFQPINVDLQGVLLTTDGSIIIKGFVENDDLFLLRKRLKTEVSGITQRVPNIIHIKIAQVLTNVSAGVARKINNKYASVFIGYAAFTHATSCYGDKFVFKN